ESDASRQPPATRVLLGRILFQQGSVREAVQSLLQALEQHPQDFWLTFELGVSLYFSQPPRLEEAVRYLTAARALRPGSTAVHNNLGLALEDLGRWAEAEACFREALRLKPDHAGAYMNLGNALHDQGKHEAALEVFQKALSLKPDYPEVYSNLGNLYLSQGKA